MYRLQSVMCVSEFEQWAYFVYVYNVQYTLYTNISVQPHFSFVSLYFICVFLHEVLERTSTRFRIFLITYQFLFYFFYHQNYQYPKQSSIIVFSNKIIKYSSPGLGLPNWHQSQLIQFRYQLPSLLLVVDWCYKMWPRCI